jgi:hypothetical protein
MAVGRTYGLSRRSSLPGGDNTRTDSGCESKREEGDDDRQGGNDEGQAIAARFVVNGTGKPEEEGSTATERRADRAAAGSGQASKVSSSRVRLRRAAASCVARMGAVW